MANTLRFKRGLVAGIPTAALGEPLFTTDTFDLYIGNGTTNTRFQKYIASGTTSQLLRGDGSLLTMPIVLTSPSNGQVLKYDGTNWVNSSDAGVTGSGANGQVTFWNSASTITGSNNLFWDATNNRLGIGTNTPASRLQVTSTAWNSTEPFVSFVNLDPQGAESRGLYVQAGAISSSSYIANFANFSGTSVFYLDGLGNLGLKTTSPTHTLDVADSARFRNQIRFATDLWNVSHTDSANRLFFSASGSTFFGTASGYIWQNSSSTNMMSLFSTGNLVLNSTTDNGLRFQVTGDGFFSDTLRVNGNIAINAAPPVGVNFYVRKSLSGSVFPAGIYIDGNIASTSTSGAAYFNTNANTDNAVFTLPNLYHFRATTGTLGASSTVTNQFGYFVDSNVVGATNNFAFYGNIASGTGRWNLYMNGTAANWINGNTKIGGNTTLSGQKLEVVGDVKFDTDGTTDGFYWINATKRLGIRTSSPSNAFTIAGDIEIRNSGAIGSAQVNTLKIGTYVDSSLGSSISTSTNYGATTNTDLRFSTSTGGAINERMRIFATGNLAVGTTTDAGYKLDVNGTMRVSGVGSFIVNGAANQRVANFRNSGGNGYIEIQGSGSVAGQIISDANGSLYFTTNATAGTAGTTRLFIGSTGDIGIGTLSPSFKLDVQGTVGVTGAATFSSSVTLGGSINLPNTGEYYLQNTASNTFIGLNFDTPYIRFGVGGTVRAFMNATGLGLGTSSPAYRLDVQGTFNATGAATFSSSVTAGGNLLLTSGTASSVGAINLIRTGTSPVASRLTFGTDGTGYSFAIGKNQAGSVTDLVTILDSGAATFSSSIQAATAIAIGTTPDTNKPFKVLKNINGTVGINFENTSTGSLAFSAIQIGTDVSGGTKFTNIVYSSSGVAQSGVYYPDGTSIINIGTGGLNFYSQGAPIRMFNGGGNGVLKWEMVNDSFINHYTGTAPTTSATDGYRQYSADVVAGNAAPHFRTENGAVIKLYQETTGVGNAIFSQGGGNSVLDDSTFDGYTLRQIVKALRNQGILA